MRRFELRKVSFRGCLVLMNVFVDDWGTDDIVVAEIDRQHYREGDALTWWMAMLSVAQSGDLFLDLGSYTGLYSLIAAKCRPDTRVIAVEASAVTYGRLTQNILSNQFDALIAPHHYALSNTNSIVHLAHGFGVSAMASGESLVADYPVDHTTAVVATQLDDLLLQDPDNANGPIGSRSFNLLPIQAIGGIKLDVEGVEVDVLEGASRVLAQHLPPLMIEILEEEKRKLISEKLLQLGYELLVECEGCNFVYCTTSTKDRLVSAYEDLAQQDGKEFKSEVKLSFAL